MDQNFREQSKSDAIYTCEKHFAPEYIEICKYMFVNLFSLNCRICFELGFHRFFRSVLLLFEVRSQCGYGFSFDQLEVWRFYAFFDRSLCEND